MCVNEARRVCLLILWLISSTQLPKDGEGDTEVLLWFHWRSCIILFSTFLQLKKMWRSFVQLRLGCLLETEASWYDWNSIVFWRILSVPGSVRNSTYGRSEFSIEFPGAVVGLLKGLSVAEACSVSPVRALKYADYCLISTGNWFLWHTVTSMRNFISLKGTRLTQLHFCWKNLIYSSCTNVFSSGRL